MSGCKTLGRRTTDHPTASRGLCAIIACLAALSLILMEEMAMAEPAAISFACQIEPAQKGAPPDADFCSAFQDRFRLVHPAVDMHPAAAGASPDLLLDLRPKSGRLIEARIVFRGQASKWMGATLMDRRLDIAFLWPLFDGLIAQIPIQISPD